MAASTAVANDRRVIQLPIESGVVCLRGLSPKRLRFEVEYGLDRGTTANSFLFLPSGDDPTLLVHPPGNTFAEPYLEALASLVPPQHAPASGGGPHQPQPGAAAAAAGSGLAAVGTDQLKPRSSAAPRTLGPAQTRATRLRCRGRA